MKLLSNLENQRTDRRQIRKKQNRNTVMGFEALEGRVLLSGAGCPESPFDPTPCTSMVDTNGGSTQADPTGNGGSGVGIMAICDSPKTITASPTISSLELTCIIEGIITADLDREVGEDDYDDGQPTECEEWQDLYDGDDWEVGEDEYDFEDDYDDGQPTEYEEWQDLYDGGDWDRGQDENDCYDGGGGGMERDEGLYGGSGWLRGLLGGGQESQDNPQEGRTGDLANAPLDSRFVDELLGSHD